jgi:hypothetical protein
MRAVALLAGAAVLAGCSVERDRELQDVVAALGPGEAANVWCEWGDWDDDTLHETCLYFVRAAPERVAQQTARRLEARAYRPTCHRSGTDIALAATKSGIGINADVIADDFAYGTVIPPEEIEVPDGHAALLLRATRPAADGALGERVPCP